MPFAESLPCRRARPYPARLFASYGTRGMRALLSFARDTRPMEALHSECHPAASASRIGQIARAIVRDPPSLSFSGVPSCMVLQFCTWFCLPRESYADMKFCWGWQQESNLQPADYKSAALPVELCQQNGGESGIRTHGTHRIRQFSRLEPSAARPSLRRNRMRTSLPRTRKLPAMTACRDYERKKAEVAASSYEGKYTNPF